VLLLELLVINRLRILDQIIIKFKNSATKIKIYFYIEGVITSSAKTQLSELYRLSPEDADCRRDT